MHDSWSNYVHCGASVCLKGYNSKVGQMNQFAGAKMVIVSSNTTRWSANRPLLTTFKYSKRVQHVRIN